MTERLARRLIPPGEDQVAGLAEGGELHHRLVVHRDGDERVVWARPVAEAGREERVLPVEDERERIRRAGDHRHQSAAWSREVAFPLTGRPPVMVELARVSNSSDVLDLS